jgi:hypothetical protein
VAERQRPSSTESHAHEMALWIVSGTLSSKVPARRPPFTFFFECSGPVSCNSPLPSFCSGQPLPPNLFLCPSPHGSGVFLHITNQRLVGLPRTGGTAMAHAARWHSRLSDSTLAG